MRRGGNSKPELRIAARMRSRASRTAASASPTIVKAGRPRAHVDLDGHVACVQAVDREACARASIASTLLARLVAERRQARPRLGRDARRPAALHGRGRSASPSAARSRPAATGRRGGGRRSRRSSAMLLDQREPVSCQRDGVEAFAVDDHEGVSGVGVDRDVRCPGRVRRRTRARWSPRASSAGRRRAARRRPSPSSRSRSTGTSRGRRRRRRAAWRFRRRPRSRARRRSSLRRRELLELAAGASCTCASAGGVSVLSLLMPSTLHVAGPTTPSALSPWRACRRVTAASVSGPNSPSAAELQRCSAGASTAFAELAPSPPSERFAAGVGDGRGVVVAVTCGSGSAEGGGVSVSSPWIAEHAPRGRADDAVDGQPVACLQAADGRLGFAARIRRRRDSLQRALQPRDRVAAARLHCRRRIHRSFDRGRVRDRR